MDYRLNRVDAQAFITVLIYNLLILDQSSNEDSMERGEIVGYSLEGETRRCISKPKALHLLSNYIEVNGGCQMHDILTFCRWFVLRILSCPKSFQVDLAKCVFCPGEALCFGIILSGDGEEFKA